MPEGLDLRELHRGALIIIPDPVDQRRNLGAALSASSLGKFVLAAEEFLARPREDLFRAPLPLGAAVDDEELEEHLAAVVFERPEEPEDVLWGELWKTARGLADYLRRSGFEVLRFEVADDEGTVSIAFLIDRLRCCRLSVKRGPEVFMEGARRRFLEANSEAGPMWVGEDGRIYSMRVGGWVGAKDALAAALRSPVEAAGAARGLEEALRRGTALEGREAIVGGPESLRACISRLSGNQ